MNNEKVLWVRYCCAWEGRFWTIHPGTRPLFKVPSSCVWKHHKLHPGNCFNTLINTLSFCDHRHAYVGMLTCTHTRAVTLHALAYESAIFMGLMGWVACMTFTRGAKYGIWNQKVWLPHACLAVWHWTKPFRSFALSILKRNTDMAIWYLLNNMAGKIKRDAVWETALYSAQGVKHRY